MGQVTEHQVMESLKAVIEPGSGADIVAREMVAGLVIKDGNVGFVIEVDPREGAKMEPLRVQAEKVVHALPGVVSVTAVLTAHSAGGGGGNAGSAGQGAPHGASQTGPQSGPQSGPNPQQAGTPGAKPMVPGVAAIVAVASGKGGVGKSTVTANLALGLATLGLKIGVLDADIYGPSQPRMLGISGRPNSPDGKILTPLENYGVKCMSMGFLVPEDSPMIWRGPMVSSALQQMLRDVAWGELDVLLVDMPPGTGDAQLSMSQQVPLAGAVIVSTPQDIALLDARKGLNMFRKVDVPVLGIIENMSLFVCPNCGHESHIFSHGGARLEAEKLGVEFLGEVPLDIEIRETSDSGQPIVMSKPDSAHAKTFVAIAERIHAKVTAQDGARRQAPKIVMQ
jgi:ATP-binding protein involved in chromosome partitioning